MDNPPVLTPEELDALAAKAENADRYARKIAPDDFESYAEELIAMRSKTNFIAACDPDTIRKLVRMARRAAELEGQVATLKAAYLGGTTTAVVDSKSIVATYPTGA